MSQLVYYIHRLSVNWALVCSSLFCAVYMFMSTPLISSRVVLSICLQIWLLAQLAFVHLLVFYGNAQWAGFSFCERRQDDKGDAHDRQRGHRNLRTFVTLCVIIRTHDILPLSRLRPFFVKAFGGVLWPKYWGVFHRGVAVGACDASLAVQCRVEDLVELQVHHTFICHLGTPRNNFTILRDYISYRSIRVASFIDTDIVFMINIIVQTAFFSSFLLQIYLVLLPRLREAHRFV